MDLLFHATTQKQIESFLHLPSHALGLGGERGAGKGTTARYIAASLLLIEINKIAGHPYVYAIDAKNQKTGIEDIRNLQIFLKLKVPGTNAVKRVAILENIDLFRHEAQNALLKITEEPPEDTVIIATYTKRGHVLPTIRSRVQQINVLPLGLECTQTALTGQFNKDSINKAYHMSGGQAGLMTAILYANESHELVTAISEARKLIEMPRYYRLGMVDKLVKDKNIPPALLIDGLYRLVRAAYKKSLVTGAKPEVSKAYISRIKIIEQSISDLNENVQAKIVLSRLFLEL